MKIPQCDIDGVGEVKLKKHKGWCVLLNGKSRKRETLVCIRQRGPKADDDDDDEAVY